MGQAPRTPSPWCAGVKPSGTSRAQLADGALRELHLFAGIGGGVLAGRMLGHRCVGAVELDPYCRRVLEARQTDGTLEAFPIHDDVRTFDATPWRGRVDVVCGGFPCQDLSLAGKRAGLGGSRSGLWFEMVRIVRAVGPRFVFVENVPGLLSLGFGRVLGDLADLGFDAEWCVLSAADCGAPHLRKRVWILAANPDRQRCDRQGLHLRPGRSDQTASESDRVGPHVAGPRSRRLADGGPTR
nr:DNA cytosine methyltransferase [Akkermansiaceae bacterium]